MPVVARLLTFVDINDEDDAVPAGGRMSVRARHDAVLADGRRVVLVGPDEPFAGHTQTEVEASHWDMLARVLRTQGVDVEAAELKAVPHDVELSDRVLARVGRRGA